LPNWLRFRIYAASIQNRYQKVNLIRCIIT
jgi:hypothetical protein